MGFLLDSSAMTRLCGEQAEVPKLESVPSKEIFICEATISDLCCRVLNGDDARLGLEQWNFLRELERRFPDQVLKVDAAVVASWDEMSHRAQQESANLQPLELLVGAMAHVHQLTLLTDHFQPYMRFGVPAEPCM